MITFLTTQRHHKEPRRFFETWGHELAPALMADVRLLAYERVRPQELETGGVFVFADLERLLGWERAFALRLEAALDAQKGAALILNRPSRYVGRYELLRRWHEAEINDYRAFRCGELPADLRFPVFLKRDYEHSTHTMQAFASRAELETAMRRLPLQDRLLSQRLMVVEKCDVTEADGLNRKYSALKIGPYMVPRHLLVSPDWITKTPDLVTETTVEAENRFVDEFPHLDVVAKAFEVANLDYGRIDYGVRDGRVQVWEINTNPVIVPVPKKLDARRLPSQTTSARRILEAFASLNQSGTATPLHLSHSEQASWKAAQMRSRLLIARR